MQSPSSNLYKLQRLAQKYVASRSLGIYRLEMNLEIMADGFSLPSADEPFKWGDISAAFARSNENRGQDRPFIALDVPMNEGNMDDWYALSGKRERRKQRLALGLKDDQLGERLSREDRIDIFLSQEQTLSYVEYLRLQSPAVQKDLDELRNLFMSTPPVEELKNDVSMLSDNAGATTQLENAFTECDGNQNGVISRDEINSCRNNLIEAIASVIPQQDISPSDQGPEATRAAKRLEEATLIYDAADKNGDGAVSEAELLFEIKEFIINRRRVLNCFGPVSSTKDDGVKSKADTTDSSAQTDEGKAMAEILDQNTRMSLIHSLMRKGISLETISKQLEALVGSAQIIVEGKSRFTPATIQTLAWSSLIFGEKPLVSSANRNKKKTVDLSPLYKKCIDTRLPEVETYKAANINYIISVFLPGPEVGFSRWRAGQEIRLRDVIYRVVSARLVPGTAGVLQGNLSYVTAQKAAVKITPSIVQCDVTLDVTKRVPGSVEKQICYQRKVALARNFRRLLGPVAAGVTWDLDVVPPAELRKGKISASQFDRAAKTDAERRQEARETAGEQREQIRARVAQNQAAKTESRLGRQRRFAQAERYQQQGFYVPREQEYSAVSNYSTRARLYKDYMALRAKAAQAYRRADSARIPRRDRADVRKAREALEEEIKSDRPEQWDEAKLVAGTANMQRQLNNLERQLNSVRRGSGGGTRKHRRKIARRGCTRRR